MVFSVLLCCASTAPLTCQRKARQCRRQADIPPARYQAPWNPRTPDTLSISLTQAFRAFAIAVSNTFSTPPETLFCFFPKMQGGEACLSPTMAADFHLPLIDSKPCATSGPVSFSIRLDSATASLQLYQIPRHLTQKNKKSSLL